MKRAAQSEYIRYKSKNALIRKWIATILLRSDLESHLVFSPLGKVIIGGFDTSTLTKDNQEDASFIRAWLASELARCGNERLDEADVFAINTRQIKKSMGLNATELAVLRFACLITCYRPLEAAAEIGSDAFAEADVCEILSDLLGKPFDAIYGALSPSGLLRQSGLLTSLGGSSCTRTLGGWLAIPAMLAREVFRAQDKDNLLLCVFYKSGPRSTLTMHDFPQRSEMELIKKYLKASFKNNAVGANVLIWGPPGTGKTEMARYLAQSMRKRPLEINSVDAQGNALTATDRLHCYRYCQAIIARSSKSLVTFDEVEDVLSDSGFARLGFKGSGNFTKGLMNTILETNRSPAIWITNTVCGVDPAYLRRFDLVLNLKTPVERIKRRIAARVFKDLPLDESLVKRIVANKSVTPAHMQKLTKICKRIGVATAGEAKVVARHVLNGDLQAMHEEPMEISPRITRGSPKLPYRSALINCDTDIERLTGTLNARSSARICLFGPPGTGKTAWASHLAESIRRPLMVKQAADILDKYVGGTEKNIAAVFREAAESRSILMLDEVDSFLPDRSNASKHWEISQANQFLTAMERHEGLLICTTNLLENLDPATMRRFDFKIGFDYLKPDQAVEVSFDLLKTMKVDLAQQDEVKLREGLVQLRLSHGDFAALLRRYVAMKAQPGVEVLLADLKAEASFRTDNQSRAIGFLATL